MAARCRSKRLVKLLLDNGADPKIINRDCKSTEDYILEDERFRSSPILPTRTMNMSYRNQQAIYSANEDKPTLHHSVTAQRASTHCLNDMATLLDHLASSFDQELKDKERDMTQAHSLLGNIQSEILESQRIVGQLKTQAQGFNVANEKLQMLEDQLHSKMTKRCRLGYEKWLRDEEERERAFRDSSLGNSIPYVPGAIDLNDISDGIAGQAKRKISTDEDVSDLQALYADLPIDAEGIAIACQSLRGELEQHRKRRKETFTGFIKLQAEAGTSGKMNQYRRLIGACAGGIAQDEVDNVLDVLLEVSTSLRLLLWSNIGCFRHWKPRSQPLLRQHGIMAS